MKRKTPLKASKPMKRARKPIAERVAIARKARKGGRKKRSAAEFARIYGSRDRVERIKRLPCHVCGLYPSENAHTENGGMGRKAGWQTIVNICRTHHRELHDCGTIWYAGHLYTMEELRDWAAHLAKEIPA